MGTSGVGKAHPTALTLLEQCWGVDLDREGRAGLGAAEKRLDIPKFHVDAAQDFANVFGESVSAVTLGDALTFSKGFCHGRGFGDKSGIGALAVRHELAVLAECDNPFARGSEQAPFVGFALFVWDPWSWGVLKVAHGAIAWASMRARMASTSASAEPSSLSKGFRDSCIQLGRHRTIREVLSASPAFRQ